MIRSLAVPALASLVFATAAGAGVVTGTIVDGDVSFARTSFGGAPAADLKGVATNANDDFVYRAGWWFRKAGDGLETSLPNPTSALYGGNASTLQWSSLSGGDISVSEHSEVYDAGLPGVPGDGGYVYQALTVHNESAVTISITIFHYLDIDVQPASGDDNADLVEFPKLIEVYDSPIVASYRAKTLGALHQVAAHPALLNLLNDGGTTTLNGTGTPAVAIDFTAAYSWSVGIPAGEERTYEVYFSVNRPLHCNPIFANGVFCDDFSSQGTSYWSDELP